jgi:hypothetical protein
MSTGIRSLSACRGAMSTDIRSLSACGGARSSERESRPACSGTMSIEIQSMSACRGTMSISRGSISACSDRAQSATGRCRLAASGGDPPRIDSSLQRPVSACSGSLPIDDGPADCEDLRGACGGGSWLVLHRLRQGGGGEAHHQSAKRLCLKMGMERENKD